MEKIAYTQHSTLLVRTAILPGESLQSLLMRLSRLNDYDVPDTLFQILQERASKQQALRDRTTLPRGIEMYERLETLTGIAIPDLYAASAHRFTTILTPPDISIEFLEISEDFYAAAGMVSCSQTASPCECRAVLSALLAERSLPSPDLVANCGLGLPGALLFAHRPLPAM